MATVKLFGTLTSPYVRRVRIVAQELGLEVERIDTVSDEGQAALREVTPIWKVPTAVVGDQPLFDSAVITQHLLRHHGPGPLRPLFRRGLDRPAADMADAGRMAAHGAPPAQ